MKKIILASLFTFVGPLFAADQLANLFNCTDQNQTTINYTSSSFAGNQTMSVVYRGSEIKSSSNGVPNSLQTPVGLLASLDDNHLAMVDGPFIRYSLVVPRVEVSDLGVQATFSTMLIRTTLANPLFHPPHSATVENNQFIPVTCTAEAVQF